MKIRLFIIFFFSLHVVYAQHSTELINQSISFMKNRDDLNFNKTFDKVWVEYLKENIPFYSNAVENIQNKQYSAALKNLDSLVAEDYFLDQILSDKNFQPLHHLKAWKAFKKEINITLAKYNNKIRLELLNIRDQDQSIRLIAIEAKKAHPNDTLLLRMVYQKMKTIDQESSDIISGIIDQYGWLGKDKIGSEANQVLFLGIQHIDDLVIQSKYLPIIRAAVQQGSAEPWHLGFLTDRMLMNQGKKQIYGTQIITSKKPGDSYVVPLENPDKVNELRKEIGLEPLEDYLQEEGLSWDLEEYKKNLPRIEKLYQEWFEKLKKQ